jgi:carboxylesterase
MRADKSSLQEGHWKDPCDSNVETSLSETSIAVSQFRQMMVPITPVLRLFEGDAGLRNQAPSLLDPQSRQQAMLPAEMPTSPRTWPLARPDIDAFEIPGSDRIPCVLLHGFTASPAEVRPIAESLSKAGFPVRALRLPGHGTSDEELHETPPARWAAAIEEALAATNGPVMLAGCSMGGLLALRFAAHFPERVKAVATLGAPLWFADRRARVLVPLLRWTPLGRVVRYLPKGPSQIPEENRRLHFTYNRFPVRGILGLDDLMKEAVGFLPKVRAPLLVIHGVNDRTAPVVSARRIHALAGSAEKEVVEMPRSRHVLTYDIESADVCRRVLEFFEKHA